MGCLPWDGSANVAETRQRAAALPQEAKSPRAGEDIPRNGTPADAVSFRDPVGRLSMAKLYFRHGTMSSGKSLNLLAVAHNDVGDGGQQLHLLEVADAIEEVKTVCFIRRQPAVRDMRSANALNETGFLLSARS